MWAIVGMAVAVAILTVWVATTALNASAFFAANSPNRGGSRRLPGGLGALLLRIEPFAALLAAATLLIAAMAFLFAPRDIKLIPGLCALLTAGFLASIRLRWEAEQFVAAKWGFRHSAKGVPLGDGLQIDCPNCSQRLRIVRARRGRVICPKCRPPATFQVRPAVAPVLLILGAVLGYWLVAVDPWDPGASPLAVAVWSAICAGLCVVSPLVLNQRRRLNEAPELARDAVDDVWIAFAVMAGTALAFAAANAALPRLTSVPVADMTVRQFLEFQRRIYELGEGLEKARLELWVMALVLLAMALSVRIGWIAFAARLNQAHKWAAKTLKVGSFAILSLSAFSLTGAVGAATLHKTLSRTFQLDALSAPGLEHSVDQMVQEIASRAIREALETQPASASTCGGDMAIPCPGSIIAALKDEAEAAEEKADLWPHMSDGHRYGQDPSADLGAEAANLADTLTALRQTKATSKPAMAPYQDISASAATNFSQAIEANVQATTSGSPLDERRHEMADLAVDLLFSLLPLNPSDVVKSGLGDFAAELVGGLGDPVKSPFKAAAQEAALRAMKACSSGAACRAAVRREMAKAQRDPRVMALAQFAVQSLGKPIARWTRLEDRLRKANVVADSELLALAEPGLRAEKAGEWGQFRLRLALAGALDQLNGEEGVNQLRTKWPKAAYKAALQDVANPKPAPDRWNRRFVSFLLANPRAAAVVSYFLLKDTEARSVLEPLAPDEPLSDALPTIRERVEDALQRDPVPPPSRLDSLDYNDVFLLFAKATQVTELYGALNDVDEESFWGEFSRANLPLTARGHEKRIRAQIRAEEQHEEEQHRQEVEQHERAVEVHPF